MKYNIPLFVLFILFLLVNIADGITAFFILPAESNPIYHIFGTIWAVIILKILIVGAMFFWIKRNIFMSEFSLYLLVLVLMLGTLAVSLGVFSNVRGILNPQLVEQAASMPVEEKVSNYYWFIHIVYTAPFLFSTLAFKVFEWSRKKAVIDKKYFSKWWKV